MKNQKLKKLSLNKKKISEFQEIRIKAGSPTLTGLSADKKCNHVTTSVIYCD